MTQDAIPRETSNALHKRLLSGDTTAPEEIAVTYLPIVTNRLSRYVPIYNPDLVDTAVEDAILSYLRRPQQYNPDKLSLERYLYMSARGDLFNALAGQKKDQVVELDPMDSEYTLEGPDVLSVEEWVQFWTSPIWQQLEDLLPDPIDREMVLMLMEGVRETDEYAALLDISHLSVTEQAETVKRHKDRLKKVLQRNLKRSELANYE